MIRFKTVLNYALIGCNVFLVFLLLFESKLIVPTFMEPLGRMHPLMLHLPIGLFAGMIILLVFKKEFEEATFTKIFTLLAGTTAFLAVCTAIFGLFLSNESGYSSDQLFWHKWTGVFFSFIAYLLYLFPTLQNPKLNWGLLAGGTIAMIAAGHIGGEITHGEGFIFEAYQSKEKIEITDTSNIYQAKIFPILEDKCVQCHNDQKTKGELNMSSIAKLLAGGKNGPLWEANDALSSHIIERAALPLNDKKHMPPKGKPQLTAYEIQLLMNWIDLGAATDKQIGAYKSESDFYTLVMQGEKIEEEKTYAFSAASESSIAEVNTPFCSVYPIAYNSPALEVKFFVRQRFDIETLKNLSKVKNQIVSLNLTKMPFTDADFGLITDFPNLEFLNLNATDIEGASLEQLSKLKNLKSLAISNTAISSSNLEKLATLNQLTEVYLWETSLNDQTKDKILKSNPQMTLFEGFDPSKEAPLRLNPPQLTNDITVLKGDAEIELKHVLPNVEIRYTLDGSDPDSVTGIIYDKAISINKYTKLKAVASKEGWFSSEKLETDFYKATFTPVIADLLTPPNKQYKANEGKSLIDNKKGSLDNFKDNNWLGYKDEPMIAMFEFDEAKPINSVTVSYLVADDGYIMPPSLVQFYAGNDKNKLKLITSKQAPKLSKPESRKSLGINSELPKGNYKYVKVVVKPINPLPSWHAGAGQKGWAFVDEVFFN